MTSLAIEHSELIAAVQFPPHMHHLVYLRGNEYSPLDRALEVFHGYLSSFVSGTARINVDASKMTEGQFREHLARVLKGLAPNQRYIVQIYQQWRIRIILSRPVPDEPTRQAILRRLDAVAPHWAGFTNNIEGVGHITRQPTTEVIRALRVAATF